MKMRILSREGIEALSQRRFAEKTAVISITDYGYSFAELKYQPNFLLQLDFDDIDGDVFVDELGRKPTDAERVKIESKYHMLSDEQAKQIADFYHSVHDKVEVIICQCEHGQSRSAAIAAAILEYKCRKGITIFADDRYYPNKTIFNKVLKAIAR